MRKSLAILLGLALLTLTGCGLAEKAVEKATESAIEKATGISVDEKGGSVTIKGEDGKTMTIDSDTGGKLPDGFPLPLFPGSKVTSASKMTTDGKVAFIVELSFKGDAKAVADFYEKALEGLGGTNMSRTESEQDQEVSIFFTAETEKQSGWITIETDKEKQGLVSFIWGDK